MKLATAKLPCQSDQRGYGNHPHDPNAIEPDEEDDAMLDGVKEVREWLVIAEKAVAKGNLRQANEAIIFGRDILVAMGDWR